MTWPWFPARRGHGRLRAAVQTRVERPRLWVAAYANGMPCYISSRRLLDEGGYEVDSSMVSYGQPARLAPEAEDTIVWRFAHCFLRHGESHLCNSW